MMEGSGSYEVMEDFVPMRRQVTRIYVDLPGIVEARRLSNG